MAKQTPAQEAAEIKWPAHLQELADKLTPMRRAFCEHFAVSKDRTAAYRAAGGKANDPWTAAWEILKFPEVKAYLDALQAESSKRAVVDGQAVLERWWMLATADAEELVQHVHYNCRHCHGIGHGYRWVSEEEYDGACIRAAAKDEPRPTDEGGYGYRPKDDPNPDCPACLGDGIARTIVADTRHLSPQARLLYAGVKEGKSGIEVKMEDRGKALENVARHLGMYKDTLNLDVPEDSPLASLIKQVSGATFKPGGGE